MHPTMKLFFLLGVKRTPERGYAFHSCKIGTGVADDIERVRAIADRLPAEERVTFDANRAWLPAQAVQVMQATADIRAYFEQPCDIYAECLQVRRLTTQPISLDECIQTTPDLIRARADGACEVVNIKLGRVGGLTKARRMRDFCLATGIEMKIMDTGGSVIADTAAVHLAQSVPETHRLGGWLCHDMITLDPAEGGARNDRGTTQAPKAPGLGVEPRMDVLGEPVAVYG